MKKTAYTKKTAKKGTVKVPVILQVEPAESGEAALAMILSYFEKHTPLERLKAECGSFRDGFSAEVFIKAAKHYGLIASQHSFTADELKRSADYPCVVGWKQTQLAVLCGFRGDRALINDPAEGACWVEAEKFRTLFSGLCLTFETADDFTPSGKPKRMLDFLKGRLCGTGSAVLFTSIATALLLFVGVAKPGFSRILVDKLLSGQNPEWLWFFTVCLAAVCVVEIVLLALNTGSNCRLTAELDAKGNMDFMWKAFRLPMEFFSQRTAGDIQKRKSDSSQVAQTIVTYVVPLWINGLMTVLYLTIMLRTSLVLTAIGILTIVINLAVRQIIVKKRVNIARVQLRDKSALFAATVSGIEMMESIKACGAESSFFERWSGYQAKANRQLAFSNGLDKTLRAVTILLPAAAEVAVLGIGALLVMNGQFTVGMIFAFQAYLTIFLTPAEMLVTGGQEIQALRTQMELIDDVMQYPCDENYEKADQEKNDDCAKLMGDIEIRNVSFGYVKFAEPLIRDFSLTVKQGSSVAIVGGTGCGKSTVAKLLAGLYHPWSGEILFGGKNIREIDRDIFIGSVGVVDQDIRLFADTVSNNIKMWDKSIEDYEVILAAKDAGVHADIMCFKDGYDHMLAEGGRNISGGQRQRLEIARVLAMDPTVMILDEATSMLDAVTEHNVVKAIRARGITCIVVAHRLSTIRDCDKIIVIDKGRIVETGTHKSLLDKGGVYARLVKSE